jgi:prolyl oligopeptidase
LIYPSLLLRPTLPKGGGNFLPVWLEDSASSETRHWIDAQNSYAHALLDPVLIRAGIYHRLTEMLRHDRIGEPLQRNGYYYFRRRGAEQDLWSFYRRKAIGGTDELLLDSHPLSRDHTTSISAFDVSDDGARVAYGVRQGGRDETDLRILDVTTHHDLPDYMPQALYTFRPLTRV